MALAVTRRAVAAVIKLVSLEDAGPDDDEREDEKKE